jgi:hypothetical protein
MDLKSKQLPIPSGSSPENRFFPKFIARRLFNPSMAFGISPFNKFPDKSSDLIPFKDQTPAGTGPENWFNDKSIVARLAQELKLSGIFPENLLLAREITLSDPHCRKNSSGTGPERLF